MKKLSLFLCCVAFSMHSFYPNFVQQADKGKKRINHPVQRTFVCDLMDMALIDCMQEKSPEVAALLAGLTGGAFFSCAVFAGYYDCHALQGLATGAMYSAVITASLEVYRIVIKNRKNPIKRFR